MKIERDKKYKLANGQIARVLATDAAGSWPVIAQLEPSPALRDSNPPVVYFSAGGSHCTSKGYDMVEEYVEPRRIYVNFAGNGAVEAFKYRTHAIAAAWPEVVEEAVEFVEVIKPK